MIRHTGRDAGQIRRERICINPFGVQGRIALHESSHKDVELRLCTQPQSSTDAATQLPSPGSGPGQALALALIVIYKYFQARHSGRDAGQIRRERICINPNGCRAG
ncbi:MAG: hypothetical protein PHD43_15325 [Methylococcales bacterium]|nr:hypothetical protein [Methylococcales bacterium]